MTIRDIINNTGKNLTATFYHIVISKLLEILILTINKGRNNDFYNN